jgi:hypothetical protein
MCHAEVRDLSRVICKRRDIACGARRHHRDITDIPGLADAGDTAPHGNTYAAPRTPSRVPDPESVFSISAGSGVGKTQAAILRNLPFAHTPRRAVSEQTISSPSQTLD